MLYLVFKWSVLHPKSFQKKIYLIIEKTKKAGNSWSAHFSSIHKDVYLEQKKNEINIYEQSKSSFYFISWKKTIRSFQPFSFRLLGTSNWCNNLISHVSFAFDIQSKSPTSMRNRNREVIIQILTRCLHIFDVCAKINTFSKWQMPQLIADE